MFIAKLSIAGQLAIAALALLGLVALAFLWHERQRNRLGRSSVVRTLLGRVSSFAELLDRLPPQYFSIKLKLFLAQESVLLLQRMVGLHTEESDQELKHLQQMTKKLERIKKESKMPMPTKYRYIDSLLEADQLKEHMQVLRNYVTLKSQRGRLDPQQAELLVQEVDKIETLINVDILKISATEAEQEGRYEVAETYYSRALDQLKEQSSKGQSLAEQIDNLSQLLEDCRRQASNAEADKPSADPFNFDDIPSDLPQPPSRLGGPPARGRDNGNNPMPGESDSDRFVNRG